jgi:hypothetical protein
MLHRSSIKKLVDSRILSFAIALGGTLMGVYGIVLLGKRFLSGGSLICAVFLTTHCYVLLRENYCKGAPDFYLNSKHQWLIRVNWVLIVGLLYSIDFLFFNGK